MDEQHKEQGDEWSIVRLEVNGGWEEFTAKEVSQITVRSYPSKGETMNQVFTLYETLDAAHKIHLREIVSRSGPEVAEDEISQALYSEEEARRDYPHVLEELLAQAKVKEALGRSYRPGTDR